MTKLTMTQRAAILRRWHDEVTDAPEMLWLNVNFEEMADHVDCAIRLSTEPHDDMPDDSWMARQDHAVGYGVAA